MHCLGGGSDEEDGSMQESHSHHWILCLSHRRRHMYTNPIIHQFGHGGGESLLACVQYYWEADHSFSLQIILLILLISILSLNSVPLDPADVANMEGGDWRLGEGGHPLNTQCL